MTEAFDAYLKTLEEQEKFMRWALEFAETYHMAENQRENVITAFGAFSTFSEEQLKGVILMAEFIIRKKGVDTD